MNNTQWLVAPDADQYQCPTTGLWFTPLSTWVQEIAGHSFVWTYCPLCDRYNRTREDADFEPLEPQPHCFTVEQEVTV